MVSYDLGSPETSEGYARVIEYLRSYNTRSKPLYSLWFIRTAKSCTNVRDELRRITDSNDKVLVMDVTNIDWAIQNIDNETTNWIKKYI